MEKAKKMDSFSQKNPYFTFAEADLSCLFPHLFLLRTGGYGDMFLFSLISIKEKGFVRKLFSAVKFSFIPLCRKSVRKGCFPRS